MLLVDNIAVPCSINEKDGYKSPSRSTINKGLTRDAKL